MNLNIPFDVEVKATAIGSSVDDVRRRLNEITDQPDRRDEREYLLGVLERKAQGE